MSAHPAPPPTIDKFRAFMSRQLAIATKHEQEGWGSNPYWLGWLRALSQCATWLDGREPEGEPLPTAIAPMLTMMHAAPELYDALTELVTLLHAHQPPWYSVPEQNRAVAALAKARGGT